MSILITLLLNFLVSFILMLIKQWLFPVGVMGESSQGAPSVQYFEANKDKFLKKVKLRFWLGPQRMARAEKAYDLAVTNYLKLKLDTASGSLVGREDSIAQSMIAGIAEQL